MVNIPKKYALLLFFGAGIIFIGIGVAGILDSNTPRFIEITETMKPNQSEIFTPDMNAGNTVKIYVNGSNYQILATGPDKQILINKSNENYNILNETLTAKVGREYRIQIANQGNTTGDLYLGAFSKANPIAFGGQMMLIITGIVVVGLGLRARAQS